MKYVVTGGAGFIGSALVERLLEAGHKIHVIDDLSSGFEANLPTHDNLTLHKIDITNWLDLNQHFSVFQEADGVFHLAAFSQIQPSITAPSRCIDTNVRGTQNILEMMRMTDVKSIVYSASSSSYGLKNKSPLHEEMQNDCLNPYAVSKFMGEELCKTWGRTYGIKNVSLKYFNVYGPRSPLHLSAYCPVIALFFKQALQDNNPLTITGDGNQSRDFVYVGDVVTANVKAMKNLSENTDVNGLTINIGTGRSVTINDLAKKIKQTLSPQKKNIRVKYLAARNGEAQESQADIALAQKKLNWAPEIALEQALAHLKIHYIDKVFNNK